MGESVSSLAPDEIAQWVVFSLDGCRYALPLSAVDRILRAAYVTPLPRAPSVVLGALNIEGCVLPVISLRRRFSIPERAIGLTDQLVVVRTANRRVVLLVDGAQGVLELPAAAAVDATTITAIPGDIRGVIPLPDGLVLIHDVETFLSAEELRRTTEALSRDYPHAG